MVSLIQWSYVAALKIKYKQLWLTVK